MSIPKLESNHFSDVETGDECYEFPTAFFRASWLSQFGMPSQLLLFTQKDDSMLPYIHKGDSVLIDRSKRSMVSGNIVAMAINDDISIRKIERKPARIVFRVFNKKYLDIEINAESQEKDIVIIGKVLWWCHTEV